MLMPFCSYGLLWGLKCLSQTWSIQRKQVVNTWIVQTGPQSPQLFKLYPLCLIVLVCGKGVRVFVMSRNVVYASLALSPVVSCHSCRPSFSRGTRETCHLVGPGGENGLIPSWGSQLCSIPQLPHLTLFFFLDHKSLLLRAYIRLTSLLVHSRHPNQCWYQSEPPNISSQLTGWSDLTRWVRPSERIWVSQTQSQVAILKLLLPREFYWTHAAPTFKAPLHIHRIKWTHSRKLK